MGNDILSTDMLVGGIVRSVYNCYQFKDYEEGCWMMYDLNGFLLGFGEIGITDLPTPKRFVGELRDRTRPENDYLEYRRMYSNKIMKALGIYNRTMIDSIKHKQYGIPSMT